MHITITMGIQQMNRSNDIVVMRVPISKMIKKLIITIVLDFSKQVLFKSGR